MPHELKEHSEFAQEISSLYTSRVSQSGVVLSDLHILSPVSSWKRYETQVMDMLRTANVCVLNGDIFDLSRLVKTPQLEAIRSGMAWLKSLLGRFPECHFHYVIGNQDVNEALLLELRNLSVENQRFKVTEDILVIGRNLFLHGDVADGWMTPADLEIRRGRYTLKRPKKRYVCFALLVSLLRLNRISFVLHKPDQVAERISFYLDSALPGWRNKVDDIYCGHTHAAFQNFEKGGKRFHNTGAAISGVVCLPLRFSV